MRADVYSFGVLVWETMARRQPWKELNGFQIINQVGMENRTLSFGGSAAAEGAGAGALRRGLTAAEVETGAPVLWRRVAAECWQRNPKRRPSFEQLDRVCRAATQQLTEGSAKLLPPPPLEPEPEPAAVEAAEAGAGMEAWRAVVADIDVTAAAEEARRTASSPRDDGDSDANPDAPPTVYQSGLICEMVREADEMDESEDGSQHSKASSGGSGSGSSKPASTTKEAGGLPAGLGGAPYLMLPSAAAGGAGGIQTGQRTVSGGKSESSPPLAGEGTDDEEEDQLGDRL